MNNDCKLFHVERYFSNLSFCRFALLFCFSLVLLSCSIVKPKTEIQDYVILPNGFKIQNRDAVNAFVFENDLSNRPFQEFLTNNFQTNSLLNSTINFKIDNVSFQLLIYDNDDFERYFGTNNFIAKNQENNANKTGNPNKFLAMSVITDTNQDGLDSRNLLSEEIIQYLKNLKLKYFIYNGRH